MSIEVKISKKRIPYKTAMLYLNKRVEEVKSDKNRELLWILEHPTTYTAGVSFNKKEIIDKKIKIVKSNRGGKITLHNPGQKIVYFVINLNKRKKDIRKLINSTFLFSIFCVKVLINSLLKSKLTFFASVDFGKVINTSISFFETISLYNDKIQIK